MSDLLNYIIVLITGFVVFVVVYGITYRLLTPKGQRQRALDLYGWLESVQERRQARKRRQQLEWDHEQSLIDKFDQWKAEGYKFTPEDIELVEHHRRRLGARKRR